VRNIFKYSKYYSGEEPEFIEGDVFRLIVPLNEDYSYDNVKNGDKKMAIKNGDKKISKKTIQNYKKILEFMEEGKEYTIQDFCNLLNLKPSRTKELLKALTQDIEQIGNNKNRKYRLK
jgi:ATP-dependent DNA helicase RecG